MNDNKFKFFLPADIEKAKTSEGSEVMLVRGIASTANTDSQNEALSPSGMDLKEFKWINYNHHGSKDPSTIIGEPTKAEVTSNNELYIEGFLYPEVPMAKTVWNLMKALKNSPSGNKLCLSVEGKVTERGSSDKDSPLYNKIIKSKITGVAICPVPVNGDTWVDLIKKGYTNDQDDIYDEETSSLIKSVESEDFEKSLSRSDIYERIYDQYKNISIEKAKSVYNLIEKTKNTMKKGEDSTVSDETINKAFSILELAAEAISKSDKNENLEEEEDEDEKEMVKKANALYKAMTAECKDNQVIKAALMKKGYGDKVIEKAMNDSKKETGEGISKSELAEILKSHSDDLTKSFGEKMSAVGVILKTSLEQNAELKKSLEDTLTRNEELNSKINDIMKQPVGSKSMITKSYQDKFQDEVSKGENAKKYNVNSATDRVALRDKVTEMSGIMKGENYDQRLVNVAQELEIAKTLTNESVNLLKAMDIEIVRG